ncbi:GNAT family N-acetyltransferase [Anaerorhabdus furcosa]|uniref:Acetyltransferase (GNAT) domain-containing protein n=1 Tax=Anaerorhabdus furcosa TaxID=118967 RepID=A0A1T4LNB6_9FIRM|nr:GNAT family N-acetyltransferase [Anaerorhabdus furcosa]SJZ56212.1 Acetyltransferase (GNAT) domain-containing protein [Anaerorhabdus furcosa]
MFWPFQKPKYTDGEIDLVETYQLKGSKENNFIPSICYDIRLHESNKKVGRCDLRIGMDRELYLVGNIGYSVAKEFRGHNYAYKACKILFQLAKDKYLMDQLIITCNPDNIASKKTCEKLDGNLVEIVDVPLGHWLRNQGDLEKCVYLYYL